MLKAVIFDLDGLLIDSEAYWQEADRRLLKQFGHRYDDKLREQLRGRGTRECAKLFISHFKLRETVDSLTKKRLNLLEGLLQKDIKLMDGGKKLLKTCLERNLVLALATSGHTKDSTSKILDKLGIRELFTVIVSGLDVKRGKPYPDIYIETANKLSINLAQCLVLEDAGNGIISAKKAGMKAYGINPDKNLRQNLKDAGADKIFASLLEIKGEDL